MDGRRKGAGGGGTDPSAAARRKLHEDVGRRIREVRTAAGVGQAECARAAEIDVSSMFRIEKSGQNLTIETLARLALALGCRPDELLAGVTADPAIIERRTRAGSD